MEIVEVYFEYNKSTSFFRNKNFNLRRKLTVIVNSSHGLQFGQVVQIIKDDSSLRDVDLYDIVRIASKKDYLRFLENTRMAKDAVIKCKKMVKELGLNMTILDGNYNFERTQLLFRFVADERVDFRQLAKNLGSMFRVRIELRQIGIRDKAKEIGGIGPCGRLLCCNSFLKSFDSVTINMAKNQGVSLNPSKINGVCGRLLCCLKYENGSYSSVREKMPKIGDSVTYENLSGKVISTNFLLGKYTIELENKKCVEVEIDEGKK